MSTRLSAAALVAALALLPTGTAHAATTLSSGHVDVIDVDWTGSALTLDLRDGTASPAVDRDPSAVTLNAVPASKSTVPSSSAYAFLGAPGSTFWVLPQSQVNGVLWPGFDTAGVPTGVLLNNSLTVKLVSVTGPADFSVYTTGFGGSVSVWFDSGNGLPDSRALAIGGHAHANWAFEAAGTYTATFEVTATGATGGALTSGLKSYTFTVQP
ncbi:surface-anchored protein [Saccharothrix coeruleofusca]|uniref:choice-of-anchor M domain-containing protein n=1 Tax=Saccharothrix coeruleofusca TaxID=33919 RepID=UPI001AE31928|nr:choice-of-anchor M domain-containing protein [Saccharothrix coeruleofusca]MBP2337274.1 surface-anchored protein [Saccharothrix coeruleofusca]